MSGVFLVTSNIAKQVLLLTYAGHVRPEELRHSLEDSEKVLSGLLPGFRLLADFARLESMDLDCAPEIGRMMELIDRRGISLLVRVIPDASKDIGMDILMLFHYRHPPAAVTCRNMQDAAEKLSL